MNKRKIILIGNIAAICIFFYLLGAFVQSSFDFTKWSEGARLFVAFMSGAFVLMLIAVSPIHNKGGSND